MRSVYTYVHGFVPFASEFIPGGRVPPVLVEFSVRKAITRGTTDVSESSTSSRVDALCHLGKGIADAFENLRL